MNERCTGAAAIYALDINIGSVRREDEKLF